jgi:histidine triad (HIT) family protein
MEGIFTKIWKGEIPSYKIAEDEKHYAFLDIRPLTKGHTLVIPKQETDYLFDLNEDLYLSLHSFARKVALAQKKAISCKRIATVVLGMEVPHAHIHLIPIQKESDISFSNPKLQVSEEEMKAIASDIARHFQ